MRTAAAVLLVVLALPVGAYGLLYVLAIWTSDSSTPALALVGAALLAAAAALVGTGVLLLRGGLARSRGG